MKTYRQIFPCIAAFIVTLLCIQTAFAQKNAGDVIRQMQKNYNDLTGFESVFIQVEEWQLAGTVDTLRGTMSHLKKDYFRIDTDNTSIMTDGKKVWEYNQLEEQLVIDFMDESRDSFLLKSYLFDFPRRFLTVDFRREERSGRPGFFIAMEPKKPDEETILALEVWIDAADFVVKMARYTDFNDNIVVFIIEDFKPNSSLTPESFKPDIPEGKKVRVIDLTKGN